MTASLGVRPACNIDPGQGNGWFRAVRSWQRRLVKVASPIRQPPFSPANGKWSSCPYPDLCHKPGEGIAVRAPSDAIIIR